MFQVLLPVDSEEERALLAAEVVTTLPQAAKEVQVTVLNVQKKVELSDESGRADSESWYDETDMPSSATAVKEYLTDEGIAVEMRREHADPATAITEVADEINADRIVMSGRKRSPTGKAIFGSVTQSVLIKSDIPVTAVVN